MSDIATCVPLHLRNEVEVVWVCVWGGGGGGGGIKDGWHGTEVVMNESEFLPFTISVLQIVEKTINNS